MPSGLRPPKTITSMGTPAGSSQAGSMTGHCLIGVQNLEFGCAAGVLDPLVHFLPRQSVIYTNMITEKMQLKIPYKYRNIRS